ncbi:putative MICAL C-terminal-like protein [Hibiscus syriacus]|uniref:MICAL C-terminal-like protein n=1 Tax=Hibiscus syriacus TaxID=106335 RepID=A0A6A3AFG1_HIBSY|nr:putative MICAL C-terminal-like protein [Hibiscus syriacus]
MHTSISAPDMLIPDSSTDSTGITADLSNKVKVELTENTIAKGLGSITQKQTAGHSDEMKICAHDLKVNGCEMQGCNTTTIGKSNMSNSFLNPEHKGNIQKADKVENLTCDTEQKLCDFAVKSALKQCIKEFKVVSTNKNQFSNSLFKGDEKRKDSLPVVMRKEAALSYNEHSALTSLAELQDGSGEDKTSHHMEEKPQMEEVQMPEIFSSDGKLVANLHMRLQRGMIKTVEMKAESTPSNVEEPGLNSKQNVSNSSPFLKGERANNHTLSYSLTGKIIKKTVQHSQRKAEEPSMMPVASQNMMSLPQKRCKKLSNVPFFVEIRGSCVQMNIPKLHGDLHRNDAAKTDFAESEASIDNPSGIKGMAPLPSDANSLMKMKLCDLRAIARSQKLKKYSTMKKEDLVKQLENRLSC